MVSGLLTGYEECSWQIKFNLTAERISSGSLTGIKFYAVFQLITKYLHFRVPDNNQKTFSTSIIIILIQFLIFQKIF